MKSWKLWRQLLLPAALLFSQAGHAAITNLVAASDTSSVSYTYNFSPSPTPRFLQVYLDTDKNPNTGYRYRGIGADYLIENTIVFKYSGAGSTQWLFSQQVGASNQVRAAASVRFQVARTVIGSPASLNLVAATSNGEYSAIVAQTLASSSSVSWTNCAVENGTCTFTGTRQVRYGANGVYAFKTATSSIACNNATFGDPLVGTLKSCQYSSVVMTSPSPSPTTSPVPEITPAPVQPPPPTGSVNQVSYSASSVLMPNPERGLYIQRYCNANALDVNSLRNSRANGNTVMRCMWYLKPFKSSLISQANLDFFDQQMAALRSAGMKTVVRFAYDDNSNVDAPPSLVFQHIDQLGPKLRANSDVITTVEAGFAGQWGEWADSVYFGSWHNWTAQNWADRKTIVDKLLQYLPAERSVQIRNPDYKRRMYDRNPLTFAEAFLGTTKARLGHHNDCFVSSSTDLGTYINKADEYPYLAQDTQFTPMGGETCRTDVRNSCATTLQEMAMFHWSQLNQDYNIAVLDVWKREGCFQTIQAKLGYRFVLQDGTYSSSGRIGGQINLAFNIVNQGFASPFNARRSELVLRNTSTGTMFRFALNSDPRRWLPGSTIAVNQSVTLPSNMPTGNYALLLSLADGAPSLANRPEYAIQLANGNVWEASTGFNNLNHVITVAP